MWQEGKPLYELTRGVLCKTEAYFCFKATSGSYAEISEALVCRECVFDFVSML